MRISDHPKLAISALVGVFFLAFALSIYSSGAAATSSGTNQGGQGVVVTLSSSGGSHVVHVSYYVYSDSNLDNVSGVYYTSGACAHNN